jgi:hypothetical protein
MNFKLQLLENDQQISQNILNALIPELDKYLKKSLNSIKNSLPSVIKNIIQSTPEYSSLIGGQLQYEFGVPDPGAKLAAIIDIWANNLDIEYSAPSISANKIKAFFSVSIIRSNFDDVLSSDAALVVDNLRGYQLPWLEWLLLEGNKTIIKKQQVVLGPSKFSRTGYAVMRESTQSWRVPSEFAGTIRDNWITRAIDNAEPQINELLDKVFQ